MDRKEFLTSFGVGAAAVVCSYCLGGCKVPDPISAPTNVDFTLDLTSPAYSGLRSNGGYVYNGGVIVARIANGTYVALSQACTHAGSDVTYDLPSNSFYCSAHGSTFSTSGSVTRGPASNSLAQYHTSLNGNLLRVYS